MMMKQYSTALIYAFLCGVFASQAMAQQTLQEFQFLVQGGSYLGIGVLEVDSARAATLKLKEERGVEVTSVEQGSPAEQAGLKVSDVVLEFAGERVQGRDQFVRLVRETPAGRKVKLGVWRNGNLTNVTATVGTRKSMVSQKMPKIEIPQIPQTWIPDIPHPTTTWRTAVLGVEAEAIEGQFAQYFGVTNGVLVRSVIDGSVAAKAGIKAGDVISKVGNTDVNAPRELSRQLKEYEGKNAPMTLVRDHKELTVNVAIAAESTRGGRSGGRVEIVTDW
jgi:serine protease Do